MCGNGILEKGEDCDDGNLDDGDGCESDCTLTPDPENDPPQILSFTADGNAVDFALDHIEWIQLEADVIDDIGVERVEFYADDLLVGVDDTAPYQAQWLMNSSSQSGTLLTVTAFDTSDQTDQAGPIQVDNNLPDCGTPIWSTPIETIHWYTPLRLETMPGGDVLAYGTIWSDEEPQFCQGDLLTPPYFARYDGTNGSLVWSDAPEPFDCHDFAFGVAGLSDGRVYGLRQYYEAYYAMDIRGVIASPYAADGTPLPQEHWINFVIGEDVTINANDRIFVAGNDMTDGVGEYLAFIVARNPALFLSSEWDIAIDSIDAFDVFANGEFAVITKDDRIARITQDRHVVWLLPATPQVSTQVLDIGGPIETIALRRQGSKIEVIDADGTPRWDVPGRTVEVDPNGDVWMLVGAGNVVEKHAGASGALLCSFPLPAVAGSLALDELGFPITRENTNPDGSIAKYSP